MPALPLPLWNNPENAYIPTQQPSTVLLLFPATPAKTIPCPPLPAFASKPTIEIPRIVTPPPVIVSPSAPAGTLAPVTVTSNDPLYVAGVVPVFTTLPACV